MSPAKALQYEPEIAAFCDLVKAESVGSYLEIGCKFGGSLQRVAAAMLPKGARIVAVDMPAPDHERLPASRKSLVEVVDRLKAQGYDVHLIWGDSHDPATLAKVAALGPFDCALLDGDHTYEGVKADWLDYGPLAKIVAFHDIAWKRNKPVGYPWIGVPELWAEISPGHRAETFCLDPTGKDNGIGVLWRA